MLKTGMPFVFVSVGVLGAYALATIITSVFLLMLVSSTELNTYLLFQKSLVLWYVWAVIVLVLISALTAAIMTSHTYFRPTFLVVLVAIISAIVLSLTGEVFVEMDLATRLVVQLGFPPFIVSLFIFDDERYWRDNRLAPD